MKYLFFVLVLLPGIAHAEPIACPGSVDHVLVEVGNFKPYPDLIPPDVGEYNETPQQEWNFLSNRPPEVPVTVHCFPGKHDDNGTDITVPYSVKKCIFLKDHFWCE